MVCKRWPETLGHLRVPVAPWAMAMVGVNGNAGWRCDAGAAPKQSRPLPGRLVEAQWLPAAVAMTLAPAWAGAVGRETTSRIRRCGGRPGAGCQGGRVSCVLSHVERQRDRAVMIREESVEGGAAHLRRHLASGTQASEERGSGGGLHVVQTSNRRPLARRNRQRHFLALCIISLDLDNMWHMKPQG